MGQVHLLTSLHDAVGLVGTRKHLRDDASQIASITRLEEEQSIFGEVVPNASGQRRDYGLPAGQILEDPNGRVDAGEGAIPIRNDPNVALVDRRNDLLEVLSTLIPYS